MIRAIQSGMSYWVTLALAVVAAGLLVRVFIIFHDCGHSSFFASRRANTILGYITGVMTFTPFEAWRHSHAVHHSTVSDLDRRGKGDVWLMTVDEYRAASRLKRIAYRIFRSPFLMFGLGSGLSFLIAQRIPQRGARRQDVLSVHVTNVAILAIVLLAGFTIGIRTYLLIQLPVILIAAAAGVWLFYVQHQFEGVYWARHEDWDVRRAALEGSSFYRLPRVLQWFTGNIGFHHIHHISPRVPNYSLQTAFERIPALQDVDRLTIRKSLKALRLHLYDEENQRLVSFASLRTSTP
jgi:omega-6 fatty acid desaturase (delta-12 desaturase)